MAASRRESFRTLRRVFGRSTVRIVERRRANATRNIKPNPFLELAEGVGQLGVYFVLGSLGDAMCMFVDYGVRCRTFAPKSRYVTSSAKFAP